MPALEPATVKRRPVYLNLFAIRQPLPAIVSILHRVSGVLLFLIGIPLMLWGVGTSLGSSEGYAAVADAVAPPLVRLVLLVLLWSLLHHLIAGLRYLLIDLHIGDDLAGARRSSAVVLVTSLVLTAVIGVRLW